MAKTKSIYFCQNCGAQSAKWIGKCPACGEWNTYVEEVVSKTTTGGPSREKAGGNKALRLDELKTVKEIRYLSSNGELDRVLGGGIVPGSVILIGGEPGIGKSTLLLQLGMQLKDKKILYVSGEESLHQIKMRSERLQLTNQNCFFLAETDTGAIFRQFDEVSPDLVIVDSIQTLNSPQVESAPGSVSQIRQCAAEMIRYAKEREVAVFLVGHITKDGSIAGPKIMEHMVDTVLQFEGDQHYAYRILRTIKNRFGSAAELGIFEMQSQGLREVENPSEILISPRDQAINGIALGSTIEGNRPLMIEVQSLVSTANYGTPQRSTTGYDNKRINMLLAVLEKRCGFHLGSQDVFINIAGGLKVEDPALDLAVCIALISSFQDQNLSPEICFAGEIGLGGEIRAVSRIQNRISEAEKLGCKEFYTSKYNLGGLEKKKTSIQVIGLSRLTELIEKLF